MSVEEQVKERLDAVVEQHVAAEIELCDARAKAEALRAERDRLKKAYSALLGEPGDRPAESSGEGTEPADPLSAVAEVTPSVPEPANPFAGMKCSGCGHLGLRQTGIKTRGGVMQMLVCSKCNNQMPM